MLASIVIVEIVSVLVFLKASYKYRFVPLILNVVSLLFILMVAILVIIRSLKLEVIISIYDYDINLVGFLFSDFLIFGIVFWGLSIDYANNLNLTKAGHFILIIGLITAVSELFEEKLQIAIVIDTILQIAGIIVIFFLLINHIRNSWKGVQLKELQRMLKIYLLSVIILVAFGIFSLIIDSFRIKSLRFLEDLWLLGLGTCFLSQGILLARFPLAILLNAAKPIRLIIATVAGVPIASFRFGYRRSVYIDSSLISAALVGASTIIKEISESKTYIRRIALNDITILLSRCGKIIGFLFVKNPSRILQESLDYAVELINAKYSHAIINIGGLVSEKNLVFKIKKDLEKIFPYIPLIPE